MPMQGFLTDERAIEGLPIRLVIAFIVGVATLSVMLNMISGVGGLAVSELDAKPQPDVIAPGSQSVQITVVDQDGAPVAGATVVLQSATASIPAVKTGTTGQNGRVTFDIDPSLAANQMQGTLEIAIKAPPGSQYADDQQNTAILVVRGGSARTVPVDPVLLPAGA
ncbi:MAG: Ig-like domain-containing protein [Halobacteriaceae archaeon]